MALSLVSRKNSCTAQEWEIRVNLAALYRLFAHYGWTDLTYTHISARIRDEDGMYLINPYGLLFDEVRASDLLKVDYDGKVIDGDYPFNAAGHLIHTAILKARPDVNFVLHSHTRAGIAVSAMEVGLLPLSQHAGTVMGQVTYHDYQDVTEAADECDFLARDIEDKNLMIMRNHGLLACGRTAAEAFIYHYYLEMACKIQVDVLSSGVKTVEPPEAAIESLAQWGEPRAEPWGEQEWPALIRMLERKDPSYRD